MTAYSSGGAYPAHDENMGQVIQLQPVESAPVAAHQAFIEQAYARLQRLPGFIVREGQRELSAAIAQSLLAAKPLAAEAPTGTGKTIAYLIGALAAAKELETVREHTVVVATATVGLQSQIMTGDLPALVKAGIVEGSDYTLAKGRGRYFCVDAAERLTEGKAHSAQVDFFDAEANAQHEELDGLPELLQAWRGHDWSGDFDAYPARLPATAYKAAASAETCLGNKCGHYNVCPFFAARRSLSAAKIIIANHDLVLSDLAMAANEMDPLLPGSRYLVVFDEAHHLPDKAQESGSVTVRPSAVLAALTGLPRYNELWTRHTAFSKLYERYKLDEGSFSASALERALTHLQDACLDIPWEEDSDHVRFSRSAGLPSAVATHAAAALAQVDSLHGAFAEAQKQLKASNITEKHPALKGPFAELLYSGAYFSSELLKLRRGLSLFLGSGEAVRWMQRDAQGELCLHSAPRDGSGVLKELLWSSPRAVVAMVSATLRDFGGYKRFQAKLGLDDMRTLTLSPIFPYHECELWLADMRASPRQDEREKYEAELRLVLPEVVRPEEATLVLFPSRALMNKMVPTLRQRFGRPNVRVQYDKGLKDLILDHKAAIDAARGSILCGLATMAEGLDLPGAYCTHVVICTLPFAVPTGPVEQALQEDMGDEYFSKKALPDTLVKLIQMVGRLMRRESDRGRITIFDNRLLSARWGHRLVDALPPFRRKRLNCARLLERAAAHKL